MALDAGMTRVASPETYAVGGWLFLRLLGLIYAVAFASLAVQLIGLVGRRGILPAADLLETQKHLWGRQRWLRFPTVCWWNARDEFLRAVCWSGLGLSLLLVIGVAPVPVLLLLWVLYLSLFTVAPLFLGYQWDLLLLESGFLAIFLAPLEWRPQGPGVEPPRLILWLGWWLLFRLMFSSGVAKLRNKDRNWRQLTALCAHYETQPLPTRLGWYAHQWPRWLHRVSALVMFVIELLVPFLIFCPSPWRPVAGVVFIVFMLLIMATGNYGFFNLLTIALCLLLFDDSIFGGRPADWREESAPTWPAWALGAVTVLVLLLSLERVLWLFRLRWDALRPLQKLSEGCDPFHLVNSYGLFSVMTTERQEIIVEASPDGQAWQPYEFKWKPGQVQQWPRWIQPHQPRLDWQMWFAALGDYRRNQWFEAFLTCLLRAEPSVRALLRHSPMGESAPRYVRAVLYEYRFTSWPARRFTGAWWQRERRWLYSPVLSREGVEEKLMPPPEWEK